MSSFSSLNEEPGKSGTDDIHMGSETVEEQIAATAEGTGLDKNKDEHGSGSETLRDNTSTHWSMTGLPLAVEQQGVSWDSAGAEESFLSELVDLARIHSATHDDTEGRTTNNFPDGRAFETSDTPAQETADHNANPSASQGQDPNLDPALEREETPPSSDTEMESGEEFDEMSDFTEQLLDEMMSDITEHPAAPLYNENNTVDPKPFNFPACPNKVRQHILRLALNNDSRIKPYWNFGALEAPAHRACRRNYPPAALVAAFAGNKKLADLAANILYGENVFTLENARIALWWLRRIGPANVARLRHLVVTVDEGVANVFGTRLETLWMRFFHLLLLPPGEGQKQHLYSLWVNFDRWTFTPDDGDGLGPRDLTVWEPRHVILRTLFAVRGLQRAVMLPGPFVRDFCSDTLERAMVMEPGETDEEVKACVRRFVLPERGGGKYSFK